MGELYQVLEMNDKLRSVPLLTLFDRIHKAGEREPQGLQELFQEGRKMKKQGQRMVQDDVIWQ